jgi:hypothetical protein
MFFTRARRQARHPPCHPTVRPRLECLEDRNVLSPTVTQLFVSAPTPVAFVGEPVTFTAIITGGDFIPGRGSPQGSVTFLDGAAPLQWGSGVPVSADLLNQRGVATFTTGLLGVGSHTITALYSGEFLMEHTPVIQNNYPSSSNAVTEVVAPIAVDVSAQTRVTLGKRRPAVAGRCGNRHTVPHRFRVRVTLTNSGDTAMPGPLELVLDGVRRRVRLLSPPEAGVTQAYPPTGHPFVRLDLAQLGPGASASLTLVFRAPRAKVVQFTTRVFAGEGVV